MKFAGEVVGGSAVESGASAGGDLEPQNVIVSGTLPGHLEPPNPSHPHEHAQETLHWHWAPLGTPHRLSTVSERR